MTSSFRHVPVLLRETIDACFTTPDGQYVDVTGGGGGHTQELLSRLSKHGKVLILDRDPQAIAALKTKFSSDARAIIVQERFGELRKVLKMTGWKHIHGVVADLGMSSEQIDTPERGFSQRDQSAILDMRMGLNTQTAGEWLANANVDEIANALEAGGDFYRAHQLAEPLHAAAQTNPALTIGDALNASFGGASERLPANVRSRFLQALRIAVNDEYGELSALLLAARETLEIGGKIAVLTFHSGEAKIVKAEFFARAASDAPQKHNGERYWQPTKPITAKSIRGEISRNPRAGSAVLRSATRGGAR